MSRTEDWAKFLEKNLKNLELKEKTNEIIDQCSELIREGFEQNRVQKALGLGKKETAIIFELAHSRIKIKEKFEKWNRLWMDQYLASYSTPELVCKYRSSRITEFDVIEAGSGAGMQSIFLSRGNNSTLSVEIQPDRYRMAELNAQEYKTGDLKFINGDIYGLSSQVEIDSNTLIFSDPARPRTEGERSLANLIPSPESLLRIFGSRTKNFVFDLPPQMKWENLGIEGEKEYLSINGNLNRLTLYAGKPAKSMSSAVMLPANIRFEGEPKDMKKTSENTIEDFLQVPDVTLAYSKLLWKIEENFDVKQAWSDPRRHIFTSHEYQKDFPGEQFNILETCNFDELGQKLVGLDAGRVFLRYPQEDSSYYQLKNKLESGLSGNFDAHIFLKNDTYIITKRA